MSPHTTSEAMATVGRLRAEGRGSRVSRTGMPGPCPPRASCCPRLEAARSSLWRGRRAVRTEGALRALGRASNGSRSPPPQRRGPPRPAHEVWSPQSGAAASAAGGPVRSPAPRHLGRILEGGAARKGARGTCSAVAWLPRRCSGAAGECSSRNPLWSRSTSAAGPGPRPRRLPRDPRPGLPELPAGLPERRRRIPGGGVAQPLRLPVSGWRDPGGSLQAHRTIPLSPEKNCASVGRNRDELTRSGSGSNSLLHGLNFKK